MYPDSPFAVPIASFRNPVPLPGVDPDQGDLVGVVFSRTWLPYILGSLQQLVLQSTWDTNDPTALNTVQGQAMSLLYLFSIASPLPQPIVGSAGAEGDDELIRQSPDNPCLLQTSIDGVNWCTFADLSKCTDFGTQQGAGAPQPAPGGGMAQNCFALNGSNNYIWPAPVNTGDVITVVQDSGVMNDGTAQVGYCPDGSGFYAGQCSGATVLNGSDPLPTTPHMSLIVNIGGVFFPLYPGGTLTVPSGYANATMTVSMNTSVTPITGSSTICMSQQNNVAATWFHDIEFSVTTSLFTDIAVFPQQSAWVAGTGWTGPVHADGGSSVSGMNIQATFSQPVNFLSLEFVGLGPDNALGGNFIIVADGVTTLANITTTPFDVVYSTPITISSTLSMSGSFYNTAGLDAANTIIRMLVTGRGYDPFA